jgi:hypothetical protein
MTYVGCRERSVACDRRYVSPRVKALIASLFPGSKQIAAVIAVTLACLLGAPDQAGASPSPLFQRTAGGAGAPRPDPFLKGEAPLVSPAQALAQAHAEASGKPPRAQASAALLSAT